MAKVRIYEDKKGDRWERDASDKKIDKTNPWTGAKVVYSGVVDGPDKSDKGKK